METCLYLLRVFGLLAIITYVSIQPALWARSVFGIYVFFRNVYLPAVRVIFIAYIQVYY